MKRRALVFAAASAATLAASAALRPRRRAAGDLAPVDLEHQVPRAFAGWRRDDSIVPVLPDPSVQAKLDKIYTQVLARTYVDDQRRQVMLSIAYGADQASDATAVHRPEFCYSAQGFAVRGAGEATLALDGGPLHLRRLVATLGRRIEPISYWVTLNERALLPGLGRKLEQIRLGLLGQIPDGMLVRVSSIDARREQAFALQDHFVADLERSLAGEVRARFFGGRA